MQRLARRWQQEKSKIGFVPTMGYLHEGHISLVHRARQLVGPKGRVVVSIFVNPTQFAPNEDLAKYPRDFARDSAMCRAAGVDAIFAPASEEMYPNKEGTGFSTYIAEEDLSRGMEGVTRPTHFRGVTTVVGKLFNIVLPDVAVFGAKDFQQAAIIKRMVRDLNFPLKLVVAPTLREPDGLAMSSRNKYLDGDQRVQALVLSEALKRAHSRAHTGKGVTSEKLKKELAKLIASKLAARLDYIEFFDPETLQPVRKVQPGVQMALAVYIGKTRLIDNAKL
jgi:pantoate--beta-alanine ligase